MCLTIPGKIKEIKEGVATVENGSRTAQVDLGLVFGAKVGDWILFATNRAVRKISENDAKEIISLLEEKYRPVDNDKLPKRFVQIISNFQFLISNPSTSLRTGQIPNVKHRKITNRSLDYARDDNEGIRDDKGENRDGKGKTEGIQKGFRRETKGIQKGDIEYLLSLEDKDCLETLYSEANVLRKQMIEDFVCIHGIIEFSNYCKNNCLYCGIRHDNSKLKRYRMSKKEILGTAKDAVENEGYKLLVLQSGEDDYYSDKDLIDIIRSIKKEVRVFIFVSVGERSKEFYKNAKMAGASGSLIRFETSNPRLYEKLRPRHKLDKRIQSIRYQQELGYYIASGSMVGLPGQTISDIADDLLMIQKLNIPMISAGPWLPASGTPLARSSEPVVRSSDRSSVCGLRNSSNKLELFLKFIAIARLMMPQIKIPVTTALETLDPENGRHRGLLAGANALMFNLTPERFAGNYSIYDNKYREREKVWQKYGLFKGEESYEMLENRLQI